MLDVIDSSSTTSSLAGGLDGLLASLPSSQCVAAPHLHTNGSRWRLWGWPPLLMKEEQWPKRFLRKVALL